MRLRSLAWIAVALSMAGTVLGGERHVFRYEGSAKSVNVAGDFNGWSTVATPMKQVRAGVWEGGVELSEGVHHYKFVIDGNRWIPDPKYSDKELEKGDNYGGVNSAVMVGPDARKLEAARPNAVNLMGVRFEPKDRADVSAAGDNLLRVRLRAQAGDVQRVDMYFGKYGQTPWTRQALDKVGEAMGYDVYSTVVQVPENVVGERRTVQYYFVLIDGTASQMVAAGRDIEADKRIPFNASLEPDFRTPDWAKDAVWYQIFPERFRNGEKGNDPEGVKPWTSKWFSVLPGEAAGMENFYKGKGNVWKRRYGGDIQGIREELPYLKKLGVNAIYLNPVFEAESMHKYDATDYRHIDDNFGVKGDLAKLEGETDDPATWKWTESDKVFLDFVAEAHRQGFKVILDGVFNHVGRDHWAFQDVLKKGKESKYAGWFDVRDWNPPIKYIAWDTGGEPASDGSLPVFKKDAKLGLVHGPREHVLAIAKRWVAPDGDASRGVDGWRLDVPGDVPHPFWVDFRKVVKGAKSDAYITGEIWDWAQAWLLGDQFDAVMNYRFADAAQQFFVNKQKAIGAGEFASKLSEMVNAYPLQVSLVQQNLFDSHDTDRLASMFVNPDLPYDARNRKQDNGPDYLERKPNAEEWARMRQAVVCQMTMVGAPMIYYGDEAGMWSADDPSNRQPMVWEDLGNYKDPEVKVDEGLLAHYRRMIGIRQRLLPLRRGYFRPLVAEGDVLAYARTLGDRVVYVAMNRSAATRDVSVPVLRGGELMDWIGGEKVEVTGGMIRLTLGAYGSAVVSAPGVPGADPR